MRYLLIILSIPLLLASCSHTKKTITELSRKADSTAFFKRDSVRMAKKDSSSTHLDLKDVTIDITYEDSVVAAEVIDSGSAVIIRDRYTPDIENLHQVIKAISKDQRPTHIRITVGDANYDHSHIVSSDSSAGHDTSSVHVKSDTHSYHKEVDRKGLNPLSTILLWGGGILLLIIILYFLYKKFKDKIPFIKTFLP